MYTIGTFSRLSHVPVRTLRYYHAIGLLRPSRVVRTTGYRYYTAVDLERLNQIFIYKDLGLALRDIRMIVDDNVPPSQVHTMVRRRAEDLESRIARDRARLARAAARLGMLERCGQMANQVAVRGVQRQRVASLRATLASHDDCQELFEELHHHTSGRCRRHQHGAIWHACADRAIDCEAFVVVPPRFDPPGPVRCRELPAHHVASLVYRRDSEFPGAYRAVRDWMAVCGAQPGGPKRELFLDAGDGEPATEIQFPILSPSDRFHAKEDDA